MDFIHQSVITRSVVGLRKSSKTLPKTKLAPLPKKQSWSLFGGLLLVWSTTAFWILARPLHLRSMLTKPMRCTKTAPPAASTGKQSGPSSSPRLPTTCWTTSSTVEQIQLWSFASSTIFTWPLANKLSLLQACRQLVAGNMLPQPAGCRKCFLRVPRILKHRFLCYRNK